jgi:pyridinium-3,5-bisthiocarboxylic acid mononucleotide nickel chelatase
MARVLYIDVVGGAAGDMLLAALLDAGADESFVRRAVTAVLPGVTFAIEPAIRAGTRASHLRIEPPVEHRGGRSLHDLEEMVRTAALEPAVRDRALEALAALGRAEARVHGTGDVHLHELGDDDTLLDVVGFAAAAESLGVDRIGVSSIPISVSDAGPATLELLAGFDLRPAPPDAGETITPTAAAVFAALAAGSPEMPAMRLDAVGYGAGTRDPAGFPNIVRVLVGAAGGAANAGPEAPRRRTLLLLEANLDDLTPELVADAAEALLAVGALDVWTTPVQMKKSRPAVTLSALCEQHDEDRILRTFFDATSTFGVRVQTVERAELERRSVAVPVADGTVRVKLGMLGTMIISATPEHDDVAALAHKAGRPVRDVYEEAVVAARGLRMESANE